MTPQIFVFGSNLAGRHGKGAALFAREQRGAIYGCGVGPQGNAYAIPTKDHALKTLPLASIARYVAGFIAYARSHQALTFELTPIGCGLAGYTPDDIAPLFAKAPANVMLPPAFATALKDPEMPQIATPDDKPARLLEPIAQRIDDDARDNPEGLMPPGAIAGFFGDHRFLSNFWYARVALYGCDYRSVEHAYQAAKAARAADRDRIRAAGSPGDAKSIGRRIALRPDWERSKTAFMLILVRRKFAHPDLARQLLDTGAAPLFEDTTRWNDRVWGVVRSGERFTGGNRLGRILETVRSELQHMNRERLQTIGPR